jgi:predicted ferric reductase
MTATVTSPPRPSDVVVRPSSAATAAADRAWAVTVVVAANALVIVGMWLRHGGLDAIAGPGGAFTAIGQLTGLLGTYAVLIQLLLMSRIDWLERHLGFDRLAVWHRWTGFSSVTLLVAHAVFITLGYSESGRESISAQVGDFVQHYADVLMAIVGLGLFLAVAVTSVRAARRRLARETWYAIHLYAYLAVALSFAHQLAVGADFTDDAVARAWWVCLYLAVLASIVTWRVGRPIAFNLRHRLRIHAVRAEADGVVSIYIAGRDLGSIEAQPGQFFLWRFLAGTGWAKAHPFSLSAPPNDRFLRITVKCLRDDTRRIQRLQPGVRVFAEGPYGTFTAERQTRRRVALIAGGIGITPIRALVGSLGGQPGDLTLLYRVASDRDLAFRDELMAYADKHGVDLRFLVGPEVGDDHTDRLGVPALHAMVPDLAERDVYLCGPPAMVDAVRRRLKRLHVPPHQIHFERFAY